jgi:hypothetical protein
MQFLLDWSRDGSGYMPQVQPPAPPWGCMAHCRGTAMKDAIKDYIYWTSLAGAFIFAYLAALGFLFHIIALFI